ncbi:MAG TPA: transcriptional repressor [Actinomycetota bacterium]|nr:transcriptional repressor [Actinomycetota bacterium]
MAEHSHQSQVEEIVGRIVASGRRRTMSRQAVIQVIVDCHGHISADDIATRVQEDFPSMDVSTVYRTLETLRELDIVDRVYFADGSTVYHLRDHQHHHLCCEKCGSVQELPVSLMKSVEADLLEEFGFELHQRPLGLFGLCKDCRN